MVRTMTDSPLARGTHDLSSTERVTGQDGDRKPGSEGRSQPVKRKRETGQDSDSDRKPGSEGHSLPVERRAREWSGQ
jgi:hypothetical protein